MANLPLILEPKPMSHKLLMVIIIGIMAMQTVLFKYQIHKVQTALDTFIFTHRNDPKKSHSELCDLENRISILETEMSMIRARHSDGLYGN